MIKEIRTLTASKLLKYLTSSTLSFKSDNKGASELFAVAYEVQKGGNLTTEGLEHIARKIAEINRLKASEIISIMNELNRYCYIEFENDEK